MIILFVFCVFQGVSEAIMDTLNFHYENSIFRKLNPQFWDIRISYENKNKPKNKIIRTLTRTVLVGFTDFWHFFKMLKTFFQLIILIFVYIYSTNICMYIVLLITTTIISKIFFELFYSKIFINNKK